MPKHGDNKHGHKHKDDVEEPLLLQRTGATVSTVANASLNYRLLHNPKFRALLVQSILSLTTFAFMSRQTEGFAGPELETLNDCGGEGCGFTKFYQFKGIVGVYAGFWGFTIILAGLYFIRKAPPPATEFTVYFLFTAAMITFLVMSTLECTSVVLDASLTVCKRADYAFASLIFATATIALNLITLGFVWRQWRELHFVGAPAALRPGIRAFGASPSFEVDEEK